MTKWILSVLKESGAVTAENQVVVEYGLHKLEGLLVDLIVTVICAAFFGIVMEGLILWIALFGQRVWVGGYHAKTQRRCTVISFIVTIISLMIIKSGISNMPLLCIMGASAVVILMNAPVEAENKPLSPREKVIYRKIGRWVTVGCAAAGVLAGMLDLDMICGPLAVSTIMNGVGVIAALAVKNNQCGQLGTGE